MSDEVITLEGGAALGVGPARMAAAYAAMPATVRLGRLRTAAYAPVPRFSAFFDRARASKAPPDSINRRDSAAQSLARMYLNDKYGCCVIAGKMHGLGLWSGADAHPAGQVVASDAEVYKQYQGICGPGDRGCVITQVLDVMRSKGLQAGGNYYKIDGYVRCDNKDQLETQTVQYLFGAGTIGINLPDAWTKNAVWDVTSSRIIGGHDVTPIDYDEKGVYVSSWGRIYLMTWAAWRSTRWIEEFYAMLAPLWYGSDQLAPCGVDVTALKAALAALGGGSIPPIPDPGPEPPGPGPGPGPGGSEIVELHGFDRDGKEVRTFKWTPQP